MQLLSETRQPFARAAFVLAIALAAILMLLSGCSVTDRIDVGGQGSVHRYAPGTFGAPDPVEASTAAVDYQMGPLDIVSISVFQVPDISGDRQINSDGDLDLPLVGTVHAVGMTVLALRTELERRLGAKYLQNPHVDVVMKTALGAQYTVDGSVHSPGVYSLQGRTTLLKAIAVAHGFDDTAVPSRVAVFRTIKGQRMAAGFDVTKIRKGLQPDPDIYGNDLIVVDGSNTRSDFRDILRTLPLLAIFGVI